MCLAKNISGVGPRRNFNCRSNLSRFFAKAAALNPEPLAPHPKRTAAGSCIPSTSAPIAANLTIAFSNP
jgi:hypothetical protein